MWMFTVIVFIIFYLLYLTRITEDNFMMLSRNRLRKLHFGSNEMAINRKFKNQLFQLYNIDMHNMYLFLRALNKPESFWLLNIY